jgi:hypothetical protein
MEFSTLGLASAVILFVVLVYVSVTMLGLTTTNQFIVQGRVIISPDVSNLGLSANARRRPSSSLGAPMAWGEAYLLNCLSWGQMSS